jgi:hypothetical protein
MEVPNRRGKDLVGLRSFFGVFWLLVKGLYGHFVVMLLLVLISYLWAAPIIWIVYGAIGNGVYKSSLLKKGYLTESQWQQRSESEPSISKNQAPGSTQKDPLEKLRELADMRDKGILTEEEFAAQKAKILNS